jgi:hypothetical protein
MNYELVFDKLSDFVEELKTVGAKHNDIVSALEQLRDVLNEEADE